MPQATTDGRVHIHARVQVDLDSFERPPCIGSSFPLGSDVMGEIEAIKTVSEVLETLNAEERARVLNWAQAKFGGGPEAATPAATSPPQATVASGRRPRSATARPPKKAKTVISMDKNPNLSPQGKPSAAQFAAEKAPSNVKQKGVVAIYYLRDIIGLSKVNTQSVFTFFKHVQWPVPADLTNTLHQAGTEGWLDTADGADVKLTLDGREPRRASATGEDNG
jgi:hypothetical protein